jgi:hypothetical protein
MTALRVLVCDDDKARAESWSHVLGQLKLETDLQRRTLGAEDLRAASVALRDREKLARGTRRKAAPAAEAKTPFDGVDIAFIDYDLLKVDHLDGENLARLVRCFTSTAMIIVVNREHGTFDLKLRADPHVWADLDIHSTQISNPSLWEQPWTTFRPWHWPLLPAAVKGFRSGVRRFSSLLDDSLAEATGMTEDLLTVLPESVWTEVATAKERTKATVRQVVEAAPMGLRPKEKLLDDGSVVRVAVARLRKWFSQVLAPGQNVIVDAPHLISRLPCLLAPRRRPEREVLDRLCTLGHESQGALDERLISRHAFDANGLLDRPMWNWPAISRDTRIPDVREPWNVKPLPVVFCEDVSRFVARSAVRQFRADVDSPYASRFVVNARSKTLPASIRKAVRGVSYEPGNRFAL